ncbi:MAG: hydrolase [Opitutales bacterium]
MSTSPSDCLSRIDEESAPMRTEVEAWANINSGSGNIEGLNQMLKVLRRAFSPLGEEVEEIELPENESIGDCGETLRQLPGKALRLSCRADARVRVLLSGHMDTVFPPESPFQTADRLEENVLRGPGVADMKGGLVVMLHALRLFETTRWAKNIGWEVLITPDEESGSPSSAGLLREAAQRNHVGLVFEPALPGGRLAKGRMGSGNFLVLARGRAAHVGREFSRGKSAILALVDFIGSIDAMNREETGVIVNVGRIRGGGPLNVVPDFATCRFNIRVETRDKEAAAFRRLRDLVADFNRREGISLALDGGFGRPAKEVTPALERLFSHYRDCGRDLGIDLEWQSTGGCCDGNNLSAAGLVNLDTLGVRGDFIHTDREFVYLDSLGERAKLTALFLMKLASGEIE